MDLCIKVFDVDSLSKQHWTSKHHKNFKSFKEISSINNHFSTNGKCFLNLTNFFKDFSINFETIPGKTLTYDTRVSLMTTLKCQKTPQIPKFLELFSVATRLSNVWQHFMTEPKEKQTKRWKNTKVISFGTEKEVVIKERK